MKNSRAFIQIGSTRSKNNSLGDGKETQSKKNKLNMKKLKIVFVGVLLVLGCYAISAALGQSARARTPIAERRVITVGDGSVVPAQTTYFVYDETGTKLLKTFSHGQRVVLQAKKKAKKEAPKPPPINCVQINCPESFGANATCWKCK